MAWTGIALWIVMGIIQYQMLKPKVLGKCIQKSVLRMDKDMQSFVEQDISLTELEKHKIGLFVFTNDSLTYWNRNDLYPKMLKRRVTNSRDTICHLAAGDYFIKSFEKGNASYYLFKLLQTNYNIENQYFENGFKPFSNIVEVQLEFHPSHGDFEIKNGKGQVLAMGQIIGKPMLKSPYKHWIWPCAILIIIGGIMAFRKPRKTSLTQKRAGFHVKTGTGIIIVLAVIGTYIYNQVESKKENKRMAQTAEKLMEKRDESFEAAYAAFAESISADTNFRKMLFGESNVLADVVLGYSKELLFDETMKAYNATLTLCEPEEEITIEPEGYVTGCDAYFSEKLNDNTKEKIGEGLFFIDYYTLDPNYLGTLNIKSEDSTRQKTLYFEFYKPIGPEGFGFPQLLQETNSDRPYDFSVANYRDRVLVYKYGKYIYPNALDVQNDNDRDFNYTQEYKHYTAKYGENNTLIISTPRKSWSEKTAPFALFFLAMLVPCLLIYWILHPKEENKGKSFSKRLQSVVLATLGLSFLAIGPVSVVYMQSVYNKRTETTQFETTRTLSTEMKNDLDLAKMMGSTSRDTWTEILQHYATTFFTDLNLYRLDGTLTATTRQEIYELNLQAPIMNAEAYEQIHRNKALYYTHEEQLGKGKYESAYIPLNDAAGNTLAYLNTPYFSSATDLHNEIRNFVLTYINIILILLGVALIFVLSLTKRLTQPLALMQSKMRDIKIDQKNEPIEWEGEDEIGALVKQYNQLIVELEKSAAELRRTTTETAWRGAARQVAHEIKNSLTPMRLSVQMLQRSIEQGDDNVQEKVKRTANTLIEQIDALSEIASSFSSYAKLPENHPQPLDLAELIQNVVNLYDNAGNITFSYDYDLAADHTFNGDKTNLNSAVGNLIKNAVQAIGLKPDGKIDVALKSTETAFVVSVKDNGKGIKEEDKSQIFLPNFTTKTGGSGVGLSLTYNIVQAAGGTISFESREGDGALFEIVLPKT